MGSNSGSNSGSADAPMTTRSKVSTTTKAKIAGNKVLDFVKGGGVVGAVVRGVTGAVRKGRVNTSLMGTPDYQGSTTRSNVGTTERGGDGGGAIGTSGQVVQAPQPVASPTTAEVSQSAAADAQESLILRKRKAKAKGRSPTIMTGVTGATGSLTLGKPSLLGR